MNISATNSEAFLRAEKLLAVMDKEFLKNFDSCNTNWLGHGIISLRSSYFQGQNGYIIPENASSIKIGEEEGAKAGESIITVRVGMEEAGMRLSFSLEYVSYKKGNCKFCSCKIGYFKEMYNALKSKEEVTNA